jgi:hypothetical protein
MVNVDLSVGAAAQQQKQQEQSSVADRAEQVLEGVEVTADAWGFAQPVVDGIGDAAQFVGDAAQAVGDAALSIISTIAD